MPIVAWADLPAPTLAAWAKRDALVILPLGAIEQHGGHLPVGTDLFVAEALVSALALHLPDDVTCLALPSLAYGDSCEHGSFPGTLSLSAETQLMIFDDLGRSLRRAGFRRVMIINGHGGNLPMIDLVAQRWRAEHGFLVGKPRYFDLPPLLAHLPPGEAHDGLHGGTAETALMQAIAADKVNVDALKDRPNQLNQRAGQIGSLWQATGPLSIAWMAEDLHPDGVCGRATLASAKFGRLLLDELGRILAQAAVDLARLPWSPAAPVTP